MASDIIDIKTFSGSGLNSDSDLLAIQGADSRYRLNVILSEDSNYEVLSNVQGNTLRSYSLPSGTKIIKGFVEDKENKAGIYFIWNSNDDHAIIRFNSEDNTFTEILVDQSAILPAYGSGWIGFADAGIIGNEDEQFLVWADGDFLKMINIAYAIAGNYNDPITDEEISFYKKPFIGNITTQYYYDSSYNSNDLKRFVFQFSVRLKYYDKTFTTISPFSEIPIPDNENIPSGRITDESANNRINIEFNIQNEITVVDSYQLLYRIIDAGSGVAGNWYIYENYDYNTKGAKSVFFYNNKSIGILSDEESSKIFDFVPTKTNHIGTIDSNRLITDVGEEGFNNVDYNNLDEWDVSVNSSEEPIPPTDEGVVYENGDGLTGTESITFNVTGGDVAVNDYYYELKLNRNANPIANESHVIGSSFNLSEADVFDEFETFLNGLKTADPSTWEYVVTRPSNNLTITIDGGVTDILTIEMAVLDRTQTFRTLKTQSVYKFGVRYGYGGKIGTVQTDDNLILSTPDFNDITSTYTNYILKANVEINHLSPIDATDYQIVSFGTNIDYYEEYLVYYNIGDISDGSADYTIFVDGTDTVIKKTDIVNRFREAYNSDASFGIDYGFDFQEGDLVVFVGQFLPITPSSDVNWYDVDLYSTKLTYRINTITSDEIRISASALRTIKNLGSLQYVLIQIIRLKDTFDSIAQEFSPVYQIDTVNRYHLGSVGDTDQTGQGSPNGASLNVTNFFADSWKSKQVFINTKNYISYGIPSRIAGHYSWMEKPKISLYYDSYPLSQGRVNAVNEFAEQRSDRRIRWGGKFIDEAGVNFLTKFDAEDSRELDDRNGVINKIQQIGNVLKVYQERKVTSFYLKTTSSIDADGNDTFVFDDAVMSIGRQSVEDYGCTHFSSYVKNVRNAYFFDIVNGIVVRDSANGFQEISNNLMHSYFKQKSRDILEYNGTINVFGGWDEDLEMYMITFVDLSNLGDSINETLGFHEPTNRWMSFYSFLPEYYGKISGDQLLSFRSGALYEHNTNSTRNNFYSTQYGSEVRLHSNKEAILNKIFNSIEINSVNQWDCPDDDSIEIERPIVMQSRLVSGKFKKQEGNYRAEFLRDSLNGGSSPSRINLLNGRQLRGKEMTIKLKNTDTDQSLLESVMVKSSISK